MCCTAGAQHCARAACDTVRRASTAVSPWHAQHPSSESAASSARLDHVERAVHPHNVHKVQLVAPAPPAASGRGALVRPRQAPTRAQQGSASPVLQSIRAKQGKGPTHSPSSTLIPYSPQELWVYCRNPAHTAVSSSWAQNRKPPSPEMEMTRLSVGRPARGAAKGRQCSLCSPHGWPICGADEDCATASGCMPVKCGTTAHRRAG